MLDWKTFFEPIVIAERGARRCKNAFWAAGWRCVVPPIAESPTIENIYSSDMRRTGGRTILLDHHFTLIKVVRALEAGVLEVCINLGGNFKKITGT